jgi:uncharacterized phiE125 gp8 family phage protein
MGLIRTTAPATEPLTPGEIKKHLRLGPENLEPSPSAPSLALSGPAGNVTNGAHRYRLTFVTADGETDGGDISDVITVVDKTISGQVLLTNIPLGGDQVTARKVYRTKAGADDFFLVGTIANNEDDDFTDNVADGALGAGIPAINTTLNPQLHDWIVEAREAAEEYLRRALIEQTWELTLDCFPESGEIKLSKPPLISVEGITYLDENGERQDLDESVYDVDRTVEPGVIFLKYQQIWPRHRAQRGSIVVSFKCGYGAAASDVPKIFRAGMKLLVADAFENRQPINIGNLVNDLPALKRCFADRFLEIQ